MFSRAPGSAGEAGFLAALLFFSLFAWTNANPLSIAAPVLNEVQEETVEGPALVPSDTESSQPSEAPQLSLPAQSTKTDLPSQDSTQNKEPNEQANAKDKLLPDQSAGESNQADENKQNSEVVETAQSQDKKEERASVKTVGEPLAPGMIKLLQDEILAGLKRRGIADRFSRFQSYAAGRLNVSAGKYTSSELAGNCRLQWYDHLLRNVLAAPAEAEQFTRLLHLAACNEQEGLQTLLAMAGEKLDLKPPQPRQLPSVSSPEEALEAVKQAIVEAQAAYARALAPLTKSELNELQTHLVRVFCTTNQVGHTLSERGTGRRLCDLMEKLDRDALLAAAVSLAPLADPQLLRQLGLLSREKGEQIPGVTGDVSRVQTSAGMILIGGKGPNTYRLDHMPEVTAVIDLGGNDVYQEGSVGPYRPVLLIIDLAGDDVYRGEKAGIQGGAVLGVSMLLDLEGNDVYQAQDVAQGSALAGIGILIDYAGDDRYIGVRRVQGQALGGIGLLLEHSGKDEYRAGMWAQGFGGPLGFGLLDDLTGEDHYFCGGLWRDSYPETPGMEGWGQGVGAGLRQVANGGIGVVLDGAGDDIYEFDYLAHGGGYWCGVGFARDFAGNDQRLITRQSYNRSKRMESSFQRFGCGWGCHYSLGFLFDDAGDDVYEGTIMGTGMAWDCSMGVLCDFAGNDHYKATGGLTQGTGAQMGFGILFDYNGDDTYEGYGQGYAPSSISYHPLPACGGNFSFLVDYGGKDKYGCGAQNKVYLQRGDAGGFLIDRPRQDEVEPTNLAHAN